ncbi:precorrin-3B C(17)-methyltransferase [Baaleninema simplex]|uniref:precorrin-3B C(17)-methyltransferase n=1 Tax=Baaleninema simplex TaxID=2862350 RepID=UPI000347FFF9|nr:precorrin-3B C(17)-methyltransferase [Baaleninema simplex]
MTIVSNFSDPQPPLSKGGYGGIVFIAPTPVGYRLGLQLWDGLPFQELWTRESTLDSIAPPGDRPVKTYRDSLAPVVAECWTRATQLIFVLPVGAVVRLIAPLLQQKATDPGVVAIAETGQFVVSVSGGHLGGADALTRRCAAVLGAEPVVTSASEGQQLPALDLLGRPYGWQRGRGDWTKIAAFITQQKPISVKQACGESLWQQMLPEGHPFRFDVEDDSLPQLWISDRLPPEENEEKTGRSRVCWHPRTLWLGLGCERGTAAEFIEASIRQVLRDRGLAWESVAGIASIALKQDEVAFQTLGDRYHWPRRFFNADELSQPSVPNPSEVVEQAVGTPSVAEAAALLSAQSQELLVTKQVFKGDGGACTIAVARASREYNPRRGHLYLIGSGPGSLNQLTAAARSALLDCDVVLGYGLYLDLLRPLFHPNQIVEASQITQEVQRAERAVALAQQGLTVGMVSSGDCGIYGMAGLVLECLAQNHWDGRSPSVEVMPGITALQAVAARVGAPLMHDFCAISLSNLMTPWEVIEKRLEAAARADFVVALYNPRSRTRTEGIEIALEIFRRWRSSQTPVAIARSLYRPGESVQCLTLEEVDVTQIDMLTVLLIGNSSTFLHRGHIITPRGYSVGASS